MPDTSDKPTYYLVAYGNFFFVDLGSNAWILKTGSSKLFFGEKPITFTDIRSLSLCLRSTFLNWQRNVYTKINLSSTVFYIHQTRQCRSNIKVLSPISCRLSSITTKRSAGWQPRNIIWIQIEIIYEILQLKIFWLMYAYGKLVVIKCPNGIW